MPETTVKNTLKHGLKWLPLIGGIAYYVWVILHNEVPQDQGDGIQHFSIAQESWIKHELFLDHWGKPLFTLLSSPFAQGGFTYFPLFNVVIFALSILLIFRLLNHFNAGFYYYPIAPALLMSIPDYSCEIIAGMTEPLFGLMILLLFYALVKEKWTLFALVASFTPFARSEGMLVVALAGLLLLWSKKWQALPWLLAGFVLYAIAGYFLIDQPWWYFENDPYPAKSVYGSGPWWTYWDSRKLHLGVLPFLLLPIGFFGWLIWRQENTHLAWKAGVLVVGVYLGIIFIHSYLWANGLKGALGLSRIAVQGIPAFIAFLLICCHFVSRNLSKPFVAFSSVLLLLTSVREVYQLGYPNVADPFQKALFQASDYLKKQPLKGRKIYYLHPLLALDWGTNTQHNHPILAQRFINLESDIENTFKTGDLLFRDSKFGAIELGLPLEKLEKYPWIVPVKHFYSADNFREGNGELRSVVIYQVMDKNTFNRKAFDQQFKEMETNPFSFNTSLNAKKGEEFIDIDKTFNIPELKGSRQRLVVYCDLSKKDKEPIILVYDDGNGTYVSGEIKSETKVVELAFTTGAITGKLYIYNPSKKPYRLELTNASWFVLRDCGVQ